MNARQITGSHRQPLQSFFLQNEARSDEETGADGEGQADVEVTHISGHTMWRIRHTDGDQSR